MIIYKQLLDTLNIIREDLLGEDLEITSLEFDSRKVKSGSAFFCIKGEKTDGHEYIQQAFDKGAFVVVADESQQKDIEEQYPSKINYIVFVKHVRKALASAADLFYGQPSKKVNLIGVTGTNGKTTVTHLIAQVLSECLKEKVGVVGTLGGKVYKNGKCEEFLGEGSGRTTPEAPELHKLISDLEEKGCKHIAMEVSSHALEQGRVHACSFNTAVFTNLTQDHLDYHVTMNNYFESKAILFSELLGKDKTIESPKAVINLDSQWAQNFIDKTTKKVEILTFGIDSEDAILRAADIQLSNQGILASVLYEDQKENLNMPLNGMFNLYNALAAIQVALKVDEKKLLLKDILKTLTKSEPAPGRFEVMKKPQEQLPTCIVDYAHTPDGLKNVLKTAKEIVPSGGRLISVFGCGGDRDPTKRPIMGKISAKYADYSIVTSDNPRTEDPNQIVSDIMSGIENMNKVEVEIDRATAIERAITEATEKDIVVVAGKGHEDYQIFADKTIHFLDSEEVQKAYSKLVSQKV